ncbi:MAG: hypothetical protein U7127_26115 [Phormidium sp.]
MATVLELKERSLFSCWWEKVGLGCFWLCDRTTSKKGDRFFQLGLENAIAFCW